MSIGEWILNEFTAADETNSFFSWWVKLNNFYENTLQANETTSVILSGITAILIIATPIITFATVKKWFAKQ